MTICWEEMTGQETIRPYLDFTLFFWVWNVYVPEMVIYIYIYIYVSTQ